MTAKEIANLPSAFDREREIQSYGESIFHETKAMVDNYVNGYSEFVQIFRSIRQLQKKGKTQEARELVAVLDERAKNIFMDG